ncbi:MarR family transcriptional regulator [Actinomycetospora cinnamomea]|uniref:MarR family transcriptional regulator n=1 Tax=Actinomycetospora cinnamomea TaxID=663609 RepID=A0A2U1EU22_9PSEU|nr:MarR family transcriptional regulator [Actinomycetospora cinnamomea]PVZ03443.1 MarR family transcriptional regulator [Actinomycetospora cinnamomea]
MSSSATGTAGGSGAGAAGSAGWSGADLPSRLRLAVGRLNRRIRVDSAAHLPPLQTSVLATLEDQAPLRLSELARREAVTPPTMSRVLAALDDAGLLVRTPDPQDARSALIELSDAGHEAIRRIRTERTASIAQRLDRLDPEQRAALEAALPALERLVEE